MNFLPAGRKRLEEETKALRNSASQLISETVINSVSTTGSYIYANSYARACLCLSLPSAADP